MIIKTQLEENNQKKKKKKKSEIFYGNSFLRNKLIKL